MRRWFLVAAAILVISSLAAPGALAQQTVRKQKATRSTTAAGAISRPRTAMSTLDIQGAYGFGFQCVVGETANTHVIGWIPENIAITIEFWSDEESDPIATLSSIQFKDGAAGGERFNSDDEGGDLNPYFRMMKPYAANWILTVGAADAGIACYSYKVTLQ
jgi:hypothetical protein